MISTLRHRLALLCIGCLLTIAGLVVTSILRSGRNSSEMDRIRAILVSWEDSKEHRMTRLHWKWACSTMKEAHECVGVGCTQHELERIRQDLAAYDRNNEINVEALRWFWARLLATPSGQRFAEKNQANYDAHWREDGMNRWADRIFHNKPVGPRAGKIPQGRHPEAKLDQ